LWRRAKCPGILPNQVRPGFFKQFILPLFHSLFLTPILLTTHSLSLSLTHTLNLTHIHTHPPPPPHTNSHYQPLSLNISLSFPPSLYLLFLYWSLSQTDSVSH
jgi:hypothetical protein